MNRRLTWAAIALVVGTSFVAPSLAIGASSAPQPPQAQGARSAVALAKIEDSLRPSLGRRDLVGVVIFLADQPSLEVTSALRARYQAPLDDLRDQIRDIGARYHLPLPRGAARDWVRAAGMQEYAAITAADRELLRQLRVQARALRDQMRDEVTQALRDQIGPQQQRLRDLARAVGGRATYSYTVVNAIAAQVPGVSIAGIARQPEVAYVMADDRIPLLLDTSTYSIGADTFWGSGFSGGEFAPGIVDTGVDTSHPALAAINWSSHTFHAAAQSQSDYADDPNSTDDLMGHGTHVAGIALSRDATYRGVANSSAQALNLKAGYLTSDGSGSLMVSDVMAAVDWALTTSTVLPDILNFSAGAAVSGDDSGFARFWDAVADDADAYTTPVAAAAGNSGPAPHSLVAPGIAYNVLCVAASSDNDTTTRSDDSIAIFSSRGPTAAGRKKPDLSAPGEAITSSYYDWEDANPDFVGMSGTSMAAPHIAGAVALLEDAGVSEPMLQRAVLINSAEDRGAAGWDAAWGWGYVDLWNAYYHRDDSAMGTVYPAGSPNGFRLYRVDAASADRFTLEWDRHVNYAGAAYPATYYSLNDLDLHLYAEADNTLVASSASTIDNVEQVISDRAGGQVLKVSAASAAFAGVAYEDFAVAGDTAPTLATGPGLSIPDQPAYTPASDEDFVITVEVANQGDLSAHGCSVQLTLPAGVALVSGDNPQSLGSIPGGANQQATWTLRASGAGSCSLGIAATSSSYGESWSASGTVSVQASAALLSDGGFDPSDPTQYGGGTLFHFHVHYTDAGGHAPASIAVNIDAGYARAMTLASGVGYNGEYECYTTLGPGSHTYYFTADNGAGRSGRLPEAGTLAGPFLCRAIINDNAVWSATASVSVRVYARGASDIYLKNSYGSAWQGPYPYAPAGDSVVIPWDLAAGGDGPRAVYAMCKTADAQPSNTFADTISLDTAAAPNIRSFTINGGAAFTTSYDVTLRIYPDCAAYVRFKNKYSDPWGEWQSLSKSNFAQFSWTLAAGGDALRAVYAQVRDLNGIESAMRCATIALDTTTAPVIKHFTINSGAASSASPDVTLSVITDCATAVRFKNRYADPWGDWQALTRPNSGEFAWTLATGPAGPRAVYAQARDHNGIESAAWCATISLLNPY